MTEMKELEIIIKPDGKVHITTRGIKGPECKPVADKIASALGKTTREMRTAEWYQAIVERFSGVSVDSNERKP